MLKRRRTLRQSCKRPLMYFFCQNETSIQYKAKQTFGKERGQAHLPDLRDSFLALVFDP